MLRIVPTTFQKYLVLLPQRLLQKMTPVKWARYDQHILKTKRLKRLIVSISKTTIYHCSQSNSADLCSMVAVWWGCGQERCLFIIRQYTLYFFCVKSLLMSVISCCKHIYVASVILCKWQYFTMLLGWMNSPLTSSPSEYIYILPSKQYSTEIRLFIALSFWHWTMMKSSPFSS